MRPKMTTSTASTKESGVAADTTEANYRDTAKLATAIDAEIEGPDPFEDIEEDENKLEEN